MRTGLTPWQYVPGHWASGMPCLLIVLRIIGELRRPGIEVAYRRLAMDAPAPRPVQLPDRGRVIEGLKVGGLHHYCEVLVA